MDEEPNVSVPLDEYIDLINLRKFFYTLQEFEIEDWGGWDEAVAAFLADENLDELPY